MSKPQIDTDLPPSTPSRHKSRGSFASPIDVIARSPSARRMSMSTTPQSLPTPSTAQELISRPQILIGGILSTIVLTGIMYSLIHGTSLDTSLQSAHAPERATYLARKSNILNQLFVKKSWGWTSLAFLLHWISSPPTRTPRWTRLSAYVLATIAWLLFTTWFFGAGLGDRIIEFSGGDCAISLPKDWGVDASALNSILPARASPVEIGEEVFLPLPHTFCSRRMPLNAKTHPDLFALLPDDVVSSRGVIPRWRKGFDISGHTFLLTLSVLMLSRELAPSWRSLLRGSTGSDVGRGGLVNKLATLFGTLLVGLWLVMLGATAVYFHNPPEKLSGLSLGLLVVSVINLLTPDTFSVLSAELVTPGTLAPLIGGEDENSARRGPIVDDGVIQEDDIEDKKSR